MGFLEPFRDYSEWVAALLGLVTVALVVRRSTWNYPFAIAMVTLYFFEFVDEKLYSDALLQIFFLLINIYGWWAWSRAPRIDDGIVVERMGFGACSAWVAATVAVSMIWGTLMASMTDAAAPYVDAMVAGSSVAAQWLQSLRRVESWAFWIAADLIAVPLYWSRGLIPTAILYTLFLGLAVAGLWSWRQSAQNKAIAV